MSLGLKPADSSAFTVMFCCVRVSNPAAFTVTVYTPGSSVVTLKSPAELLVTVVLTPVASLVMTMVAPGTTAPVGS